MRASLVWSPAARRWWSAVVGRGLVFVGLSLAVAPYLRWACFPSLFDDDLTRVGGFRRLAMPAALLHPFNEHLAPLFELVGWLAWWGSGRRVEAIASGLLVASYLAWGATVALLGLVVRLELRSSLAALLAVVWFCQAPVAAETVLWYSASSFQWAAAASLAAWYATTRALHAPTRASEYRWLAAAAGLAAAAPLFSAIGALSGPLASLRWLLAARSVPIRSGGWRRRFALAAVPLSGTLAYVALVVSVPAHGGEVAASVRSHLDVPAAIRATIMAPGAVLVPMTLGLPSLAGWLPAEVAIGLSLTLLALGIIGAVRSPHRGFLIVALGWVGGGYLLAYAARAQPGDRFVLDVGRYHLFPEVGIVCWVAAGLRPGLTALAARTPRAGLGAVVALAAVGLAVQGGRIAETARWSFRFPEQGRAIAAALRLEALCRAEEIPLTQAIRIINPTEPRWFPRPLPFHPLLYLFGPGPTRARQGDTGARTRLLGGLTADEREVIFGGLDAARYRSRGWHAPSPTSEFRLEPTAGGSADATGEGALDFRQFTLPANVGEVVALDVAGIQAGTRVELWWANSTGGWSPTRSVRWTAATEQRWLPVVPLPHWRPDFARQFRIVRRRWPIAAADHPVLVVATQPG